MKSPSPTRASPTTKLILFTKYPVAGSVKTRLEPALGKDGAAALHRKLAKQTFDTIAKSAQANDAVFQVQTSGAAQLDFEAWLGQEAEYAEQCDGDLTDRLLHAATDFPLIFFGADTPDLSTDIVSQAIVALKTHDAVIGPAEDGGYYLIGISRPMTSLFTDMEWSTEHVLPTTLERLKKLDIEPYMLETLADCDRPEDLPRWPELTQ